MPAIRGLTVSVGRWYADLLRITLPRNMRHFTECVVVTAPDDPSIEAAADVPGVTVSVTDAFTRPGADGVRPYFNKGLAVEEAGFAVLGRRGWCAIWDADILFPDDIHLERLQPGKLHGAKRRILEDVTRWHPGLDWGTCPLSKDGGPIGFTQIFSCDDPCLAGKPYWYDPTFTHGGGCDAFFMTHWGAGKFAMLPVECLHLGPKDRHWFGCDPESVDRMAKFVTLNGWTRAAGNFTREQVERAGDLVERVEVPGYVSNYELPFVKRAQALRSPPGPGR
jgi:hypothetical protein